VSLSQGDLSCVLLEKEKGFAAYCDKTNQ